MTLHAADSAAVSAPPLAIFGASGFVGGHLLARMAATWPGDVRAIARRPIAGLPPRVTTVEADLLDADSVGLALPPGAVIVNLAYAGSAPAAENLAMAAGLAQACARSGAARLVHVSTATVVGRAAGRLVSESTVCRPATPYQATKLDIERLLIERRPPSTPLVILRPTAVFGANGLNLRKLAADLAGAPAPLNYLRSSLFGRRRMNLVPVETVVAAIEFALTSDRAPSDGLYIVADDEVPENNFRDVERILLRGLGRSGYRVPPVPMPNWILAAVLGATGRLALAPSIRFSSARLRQAGFVAPVGLVAALEAYAAALRPPAARPDS